MAKIKPISKVLKSIQTKIPIHAEFEFNNNTHSFIKTKKEPQEQTETPQDTIEVQPLKSKTVETKLTLPPIDSIKNKKNHTTKDKKEPAYKSETIDVEYVAIETYKIALKLANGDLEKAKKGIFLLLTNSEFSNNGNSSLRKCALHIAIDMINTDIAIKHGEFISQDSLNNRAKIYSKKKN